MANIREPSWTWSPKAKADLGVVYRTDAVGNKKIRILDEAPEDSHTPVHYGVAAVWTAKNISGAGDFINFLGTPRSKLSCKTTASNRIVERVGVAQRQEGQ